MEPQTVNLDSTIAEIDGKYVLRYCNTDPDTVVGALYTSVTTKYGGEGGNEPVKYGWACPYEECPQYDIFLGYVDDVTDKHAWAVLYDRRNTTLTIQSSPSGIISGSVNLYRGAIVDDYKLCSTNGDAFLTYDGTLWDVCRTQSDSVRPGSTIGANPHVGYVFAYFTGHAIDDDATYTVEFTKTYEIIYVYSGRGGTATTSSQPSFFCDGGSGYERGTTVTLTATPEECYEFVRWEAETSKQELYEDIHGINGSTSSQITITASGFYSSLDRPGDEQPYNYFPYTTRITAIFRKKTFRVAFSCSPLSGGDITSPYQDGEVVDIECGEVIDCTAVAAQCYWLDYWSINGRILRVWIPSIVVDRNYDIVAHFVEKKYKTQGTSLVHDDNGRLIYKCGGRLIYGSCTEDDSKKPILQTTGS